MMRGFSFALKGIGGQYELNRVVGVFGGVAYIVGAVGLTGYDVIVRDREGHLRNRGDPFCAA